MCNILGFHSTPSIGKYLRIQIKHSAVAQDFGYIIKRVQSKLAGQKANLLSFSRRLVLTQAVTITIHNYAMQCVALLAKILSSVDKLSRNFLWGSLESKKKIHLVSWKKSQRKMVGLGVQAVKEKNIANLAKLNWHLQSESSSLWAKVLSQKYQSPRKTSISSLARKACSSTQVAIRKGEPVFKKGSKWIVGKDSQLFLWFDKWLDKEPFRSLIVGPLNRSEEGIMLKEVVNFLGWKWQGCSFAFPKKLLLEMKATPISFSAHNTNCITWSSSPSGKFDMKEAYKLASMEVEGNYNESFDGDWIWRMLTIPKVKCFLWQC